MNEEFLIFLSDNREEIESLYQHAFKYFKNEIEPKANEIDSIVELANSGFQRSRYNPGDELKYVQVYKNRRMG